MRILLTSILIIGVFSAVVAQKPKKVCGEYTYVVPESTTPEQARQIALHQARVDALVREFGQTVHQDNTTVITNRDGDSETEFVSIGGSETRGEWIEDVGEPSFEWVTEHGKLAVKVSVCGKARKIKSAGISIMSKVLRNGTDPKFEADSFNDGDDMYLYFKSPSDGWLNVYLLDRSNKIVYLLLPYRNSDEVAEKVSRDREYVFFHQNKRQKYWQDVDEYTMTCEGDAEWNEIYAVFSPNRFGRPMMNKTDDNFGILEIPFKDFQKWLVGISADDPDVVVNKHLIEIRKR